MRAPGFVALAFALGLFGCGGTNQPGSAPATGPAATSAPVLRLPVEQAAAQLVAVGFGGTSGSDPGVRRLGDHPWGAVVIEAHNARSPASVRALVRAIRRQAAAAGLDASRHRDRPGGR